jgi:gluconokinase
MGVSGTGKSTVAAALAAALGVPWVDGDDLHSPDAVARMRAGVPLTDDDRWPWLDRIGARLGDRAASPAGLIVACSALRRAYRERLRAAAPGLRFVYLEGSAELIGQRLQARRGHYMPPGLLASQLQTLEPPASDEADVLPLGIDGSVEHMVARALEALR